MTDNETFDAEPFENKGKETGLQAFVGLRNLNHVQIADAIKHELKEGTVDPMEMYIALRRVQGIVDLTISSEKGDKEIKELLKSDLQKKLDGGKSLMIFGAELAIRPTGTRYDFTQCGDDYLDELYKIQKTVAEAIKKREDEIKAILPPDSNKLTIQRRTIIQEVMPSFEWVESGHDDVISPPVKYQGSSIVCTFKKDK